MKIFKRIIIVIFSVLLALKPPFHSVFDFTIEIIVIIFVLLFFWYLGRTEGEIGNEL